jgi:hypothetical protein
MSLLRPEPPPQECVSLSGAGPTGGPLCGEVEVGPDLLPGKPGTLLSSWCFVVLVLLVSDVVLPDDVSVGPDLLPGSPATPGLDVPPVPGAFCF